MSSNKPFAVVTGASSGIGFEIARELVNRGYDLLIAADELEIQSAATDLGKNGESVQAVQADLATEAGVDKLLDAAHGRRINVLAANAGRGLGHGFLEQNFEDVKQVINTNITGTIYLLQKVATQMRDSRQGHILISGSIAGFMPGTYAAVYNGTKAFIDSFSFALRAELDGSGVTVTCLMPGATETRFFERANMLDTKVGQAKKDNPRDVAIVGLDAMFRGDGDVVSGWSNKLQTVMASFTPSGVLAEQHRKMAEPGSGNKS